MEPPKKWTSTYFQDIAQCGQELVILINQINCSLPYEESSRSVMEDLYVRLNVKGSEMSQLCTSKLRKRNQNSKGTGITVPETILVQVERSCTDFLLRVAEVEKAIKDLQNKKNTVNLPTQNTLSLSSSQNTFISLPSSMTSSMTSSVTSSPLPNDKIQDSPVPTTTTTTTTTAAASPLTLTLSSSSSSLTSSSDTKPTSRKDRLKECLDELLSSLKRLLLVGSQITKVESKRQVPPIILGCKSRATPSLSLSMTASDGLSSSASGSSSSLVSHSSSSLLVMRPVEVDPTAHGAAAPSPQESVNIAKSECEKLTSVLEKYADLLKDVKQPLEIKGLQELTRPFSECYHKVYNAAIALNASRLAEEFKDRCSLLLGLLKAVAAKPDEDNFKEHALKSVSSLIEYKNAFIFELLRFFSGNDSVSVATDNTTSTSSTGVTTTTSSSSDSNNSGSGSSGRDRASDSDCSPPNLNVNVDCDKSSSSSDSDSLSSVALLSPNVSELEHIIHVKNDIIARLKKTIDKQAEEIRSLADAITKSPTEAPLISSNDGNSVVSDVLKAREEAVHRREETLDSLYESYNNDLDDYKRKHGAFSLEKKKYEKEKKRLREERMRIKEAKDSVQRDLALVREERRQLEAQRAAEIGLASGEGGKHARRATSPMEVGKFAKSAAVAAAAHSVKLNYPKMIKREQLYQFAAEHIAILTKHFPGFASEWGSGDKENLDTNPAEEVVGVANEMSEVDATNPGTKVVGYQNDLDALIERFSISNAKSKVENDLDVSGADTDESDSCLREKRERRGKRRLHRHRKGGSSNLVKNDMIRSDGNNCGDEGNQEVNKSSITIVIDNKNETEKKIDIDNEEKMNEESVNKEDNSTQEKKDESGFSTEDIDIKVPESNCPKNKSEYKSLTIDVDNTPKADGVPLLINSYNDKKDLNDENYSSLDEFSPVVARRQASLGSSLGSECESTTSSNSSDDSDDENPINDALELCRHFNDILREKVNLKAIFSWNRVLVEFRLLRAMFPGYVASQRDSKEVDELHARVARYHGSIMQLASKFGNVTVKTSTSIVARLTAEILSGTSQKEPINNKRNIEHSRKYLLELLRSIQADVADLKSSEALVKVSSMVITEIEHVDIAGMVNKDLITAAEHSQHLREVILTELISAVSVDCGHLVTLTSQMLAIVCRMPFAMSSARAASAPLWELCTCAYRFVALLAGLATRYETSKCLRAVLCATKANPSFFVIHNTAPLEDDSEPAHESETSTASTEDSAIDLQLSDKSDERISSPLWDESFRDMNKSTPHVLTLDELIYRITDPTNIDALTLKTAVVTSLSYAEPKIFLSKLIERFNAPSWIEESTVIKVRTRVILVLTNFIEAQFDDFDADTLRMLQNFIDGPIMHSSAALGVILRKDYERKTRISRQRLLVTQIPTTTLTISPSTRSPLELFFELDEVTVARQLTMATFSIFSAIEPKELLEQAWARPKLHFRAQNVVRLIERSKLLAQLVGILILARPTPEARAFAAEKILRVIASLNKLNNFNDMAAMHAGFLIPAVRRLNGTKDLVDPKCLKMHKYCDKMFSQDNSFKHYKHALNDAEGPTIPLLSVILDELVEIDSGGSETNITIATSSTPRPGLINFKKRLAEYNLIEDIQQYQKNSYNFPIIEPLYAVFTSLPACSEDILYELSLIYEPKKPSIPSKLSQKTFKSSKKVV